MKQSHLDPAGYLSSKTIAALCTQTGGAICVLRISGDDAVAIAEKMVGKKFEKNDARKALRTNLFSSTGKKLDDAVVLPFFAPASFTGEDVVELFLHGSPMIAEKVLDEIFASGARLALPGEFSFRAVKNGKMTISQAEAVKELVKAENDFALDLALEKLSGSQHVLIENIRLDLMQLLTLSEVGIDFSDQDIDEVSLPRLRTRLEAIITSLLRLKGSFDRGKAIQEGILVTIFGLPNAGKSSFFNALLGEDRSIVSNIAGTTRDIVREKINLKGENGYATFKIADTAGLRHSDDEIEGEGIQRSLKAAASSDLILLVIDGANPNWIQVQNYLRQIDLSKKTVIGVITKKDLLSPGEQKHLFTEAKKVIPSHFYFVSSPKLDGITEVTADMTKLAARLLSRNQGEVVLTEFSHVQAVNQALDCLERAKLAFDLVLFATDVRHGMNELGPLIGETIPDDVLGKIFSDFCIGK